MLSIKQRGIKYHFFSLWYDSTWDSTPVSQAIGKHSTCCIVITMIHIQLYTYTCGNKINNNDERTHFFRKIYLSHFIQNGCKRVMCERWVGDWTDCNILTPSSSVFSSTSFLFCWAAQPGSWGPSSLWELVLTIASYFQLTERVCGTGLYNCLTLTCFLWASHLHPIQPNHSQGYTLISSTGCTCYLHRRISYLTTRPRVNMLCTHLTNGLVVMFWPFDPAKNAIQGDAPEGGDTF